MVLSLRMYCILFYSILFYSILFYSTLIYSNGGRVVAIVIPNLVYSIILYYIIF